MTRAKSSPLVSAGIVSLFFLALSGCASFNLINPTFLNQFQPFGITSLNTVQGKGPVTVVLENLTVEAKHQENALITIHYIDAQGNPQIFTSTPLNAVPKNKRNPSVTQGPNAFDSSYRQVIILDCGVREIWVTGIVYRTRITNKQETVVLTNQQSQTNTYCTASVTRQPTDLKTTATRLTTVLFDSFPAVQTPPSHLQETLHFQCGDVILVGLLDQRMRNQKIDLQPYTCDWVDLNSLSKNLANNPNDPNLFTFFFFDPLYFNPSHSELEGTEDNPGEYLYPTGYVLIPLALPDIAGIDQALALLEQMAAQNAPQ